MPLSPSSPVPPVLRPTHRRTIGCAPRPLSRTGLHTGWRPQLLLPVMLVLSLASAGCEPRQAPTPARPAAAGTATASTTGKAPASPAAASTPSTAPSPGPASGAALDEAATQAILKRHHCTSCHQTTRKVVGPAFRAVAERYAGVADAEAQVAGHIRQGGSGRWGPVPMPPQSQLDDDELAALTHWVLSQRPR